jgi:pimeloyl-ACP methyl ester carboxylesterase
MSYTEWGAPSAERVAICVHGLTRQGRDFDALAVALGGCAYRVICPDLVGRGRSDWLAHPEDYEMPQYVGDMVTLLARSGAREIDFIGTSLGGMIGIHLAALAGAPIRRLVVNDIGPFLPWQALDRIATYLQRLPKSSFPNWSAVEAYFREILAPYGALGEQERLHLAQHSVQRDEAGGYRLRVDPAIERTFRPVKFWNVTMWEYWDAIRCPVLILRGAHSDLLTREVAKAMTRRGPKATLVEFPDCGHAPALLNDRQTGAVVRWLTQAEIG